MANTSTKAKPSKRQKNELEIANKRDPNTFLGGEWIRTSWQLKQMDKPQTRIY